jgi:hypothetical protein
MSLQEELLRFEQLLPSLPDKEWDLREWPSPEISAGMRVHRLWRRMGKSTQLMLHRFLPEPGVHDPHAHPMAVCAHVLGPGEYEVGFIVGDVCHARLVCDGDFYYEMRTPAIKHYVLPRSGPIYSVCIWTSFPRQEVVPDVPLKAVDHQETLAVVTDVFERLWPV